MTFASKCPNCGQLVPLNDDQLLRARQSTAEDTARSAAGFIETRLYAVHRCPAQKNGQGQGAQGSLTEWEISAETPLFFAGTA